MIGLKKFQTALNVCKYVLFPCLLADFALLCSVLASSGARDNELIRLRGVCLYYTGDNAKALSHFRVSCALAGPQPALSDQPLCCVSSKC